MTQLIPDGDANVIFRHSLTGVSEQMLIIIGIEMPPDFVNANGVAAANDLHTKWATEMKTSVTNETTFVGATILRKEATGFLHFDSTNAGVVGTSSGSALPPNVAILGIKSTDRGGQSGKGRMFLPGVSEAAVDSGGTLSAAFVAQIGGDFGSAFTAIENATSVDDIMLWHEDSIVSPAGTKVTGFGVSNRIATIRRRYRRF
jgi:hypothetical protein